MSDVSNYDPHFSNMLKMNSQKWLLQYMCVPAAKKEEQKSTIVYDSQKLTGGPVPAPQQRLVDLDLLTIFIS